LKLNQRNEPEKLPPQKRPATTPSRKPGSMARGSLREADIEMLWKGRNNAVRSDSRPDSRQGGYSFTKASRFEDANAKAPSITSYIQHLKNTVDADPVLGSGSNGLNNNSDNFRRIRTSHGSLSKSTPDLRDRAEPNGVGPGAYISYHSHDAVDPNAHKFTFQRAGAKRHIKQGRACFDIPRSQMDPVTLKCPRGMEMQSASWTKASIGGVLARRGCTISAKSKKFPEPNKDFMMSCPGVFNIDHGKHMSIKRRVETSPNLMSNCFRSRTSRAAALSLGSESLGPGSFNMSRTQQCASLELVGVKDSHLKSAVFQNVGGRTAKSQQESYGRLPAKSNVVKRGLPIKQHHKRNGFTVHSQNTNRKGFLLLEC